MEKIEVVCSICDAGYKIYHDLDEPYVLSFCAFCGEGVDEELLWGEETEDD